MLLPAYLESILHQGLSQALTWKLEEGSGVLLSGDLPSDLFMPWTCSPLRAQMKPELGGLSRTQVAK